MGRIGSGRWQREGTRATTAACCSLDVLRWHRDGILRAGSRTSWAWEVAGEVWGSVGVATFVDRVELAYTLDGRVPIREAVSVVWTPCTFGGARPGFAVRPGTVPVLCDCPTWRGAGSSVVSARAWCTAVSDERPEPRPDARESAPGSSSAVIGVCPRHCRHGRRGCARRRTNATWRRSERLMRWPGRPSRRGGCEESGGTGVTACPVIEVAPLTLAAFHQAGHAAVAHHLGIPLDGLTLGPCPTGAVASC